VVAGLLVSGGYHDQEECVMSDRAVWERVPAGELRRGDVFARSRKVARAMVIVELGPMGAGARYITYRPAAGSDARTWKIRPAHDTLFWRLAS
jgi:hypothetical protein